MAKKNQPAVIPANKEVIEETSLELAIPQHLVEEVVQAQSAFTAEKIRKGGFEGVMWPKFAKIRVKVTKVHQLHDILGASEIRKNTKTNKK